MSKVTLDLKKAFGPLWPLYNNPEVHEILVDGVDEVYYTQKDKILNSNKLFKDEKQIMTVIKNLTAYAGKTVPAGVNFYDLTIGDTTRIHVTLAPISLNGPVFNILRLPKQNITLSDLLKWKALDEKSFAILQEKIKNPNSMIVAGPMGSGKTTLLNCIVDEIPEQERIVTIETTPHLIIKRKRCVRLVAENNTIQETKDLIGAALKMRADRIILASMQGPEMVAFVNGVREGHVGYAGLTAENIFDVIRRLEIMAMGEEPGLSLDDTRYSIAQAFKIIVFQERLPSGQRKVTRIAEIRYDAGEIKLEILYKSE
jgi:pilus assembly protein CpaF